MSVEFIEAENYLKHSAEIYIIKSERYYEQLENHAYRILMGKFLAK
jgi:hypothetical protein